MLPPARIAAALAWLAAARVAAAPVVQGSVDGKDRAALARAVKAGGGEVAWGAVVIHHSGEAGGSAEEIDRRQREALRDTFGLVHHFVIGNGTGTGDGVVEIAGLWARGVRTPHLFRRGELPPAISVALVGDLDASPPTAAQLVALSNLLSVLAERYGIPASRILTHREVEGRGTTCPGRTLQKLEVLDAARLTPAGAPRVRVEAGAGRVSLLRGEEVVQRFLRSGPRPDAPLPVGTWPVCRRDEGGAFGRTVVIAYPGPAEVAAAQAASRIGPEEAKRLLHAFEVGRCPPDDTPLGGEVAIHAVTVPASAEGTPCVDLDPADAEAVFRAAEVGTPVEIVP